MELGATLRDVKQRRTEILAIMAEHQAASPRIIAVHDGEHRLTEGRSVEFLVEWADGNPDYHRWGRLQTALSILVGFQVDIQTAPTLPPAKREAALRSAEPL